jgi:DNA-binding NtrC family response regulator
MSDGQHILIIDDEPDVGEILVDILQPVYEKVTFLSSPEEAKAAIGANTYTLIISDVNMPKIPGPELVRVIRAQGQLVPIMFLTGYANKETVLTALRLGVADVIEKPFDSDGLLKSIERILEIDKRKTQLIIDNANREVSVEKLEKQRKMLGLLHVINDKKKPA